MIGCASTQQFYWGRFGVAFIALFLSSQQQTAIAQCEHVICPPAGCQDPIRIDGECCDICLLPPSKLQFFWKIRNVLVHGKMQIYTQIFISKSDSLPFTYSKNL